MLSWLPAETCLCHCITYLPSTAHLDADLYNDTMPKYRMTAADYAAHAAWTAAVNAQLPAGSNFK
jgi:hypothetical protein